MNSKTIWCFTNINQEGYCLCLVIDVKSFADRLTKIISDSDINTDGYSSCL